MLINIILWSISIIIVLLVLFFMYMIFIFPVYKFNVESKQTKLAYNIYFDRLNKETILIGYETADFETTLIPENSTIKYISEDEKKHISSLVKKLQEKIEYTIEYGKSLNHRHLSKDSVYEQICELEQMAKNVRELRFMRGL